MLKNRSCLFQWCSVELVTDIELYFLSRSFPPLSGRKVATNRKLLRLASVVDKSFLSSWKAISFSLPQLRLDCRAALEQLERRLTTRIWKYWTFAFVYFESRWLARRRPVVSCRAIANSRNENTRVLASMCPLCRGQLWTCRSQYISCIS